MKAPSESSMRRVVYTPASIDIKPDPNKYYGVTLNGYEKPSEFSAGTRAFLVAITGYPNPDAAQFRVVNALHMTCANNWESLEEKPKAKLKDYIIYLYQKGFNVIEFNTAKELFAWLSECEDKLPRKSGWN